MTFFIVGVPVAVSMLFILYYYVAVTSRTPILRPHVTSTTVKPTLPHFTLPPEIMGPIDKIKEIGSFLSSLPPNFIPGGQFLPGFLPGGGGLIPGGGGLIPGGGGFIPGGGGFIPGGGGFTPGGGDFTPGGGGFTPGGEGFTPGGEGFTPGGGGFTPDEGGKGGNTSNLEGQIRVTPVPTYKTTVAGVSTSVTASPVFIHITRAIGFEKVTAPKDRDAMEFVPSALENYGQAFDPDRKERFPPSPIPPGGGFGSWGAPHRPYKPPEESV